MKILDVSYCQKQVDWPAVKAAGIEAVIAKCSQGLEKDTMFDSHMQGALGVGLPVGAYHYMDALGPAAARQEAEFAVSVCKPYPLTWPLYVDMEGDTMNGNIDAVAVTFCECVISYGYKGGVYASLSNLRRFTWDLIKGYSTWCAQYNYGYCSFEHKVDLWQETEEGWINGIPRTVDLNVGYTNYVTGAAALERVAQPDAVNAEELSTLELQRMLNLLNFGMLEEDGEMGPATESVVRSAQAAYWISDDGIPGPITWSKLCGQVNAVQRRLVEIGYNISVDGRLGESGTETTNAVRQFQTDNGLSVDGIIGPVTFALMFNQQPSAPASPDEPTIVDPPTPSGYDHHQQMTEHFNRWEFACECAFEGGPGYCDGFPADIHEVLVVKLEEMRVELGFPLNISSGVRCARLNAEVGGVPDSQHMLGRAADVPIYSANGVSVSEFAALARSKGLVTIEYEEQSFVHVQWNG